MHPSNYGQLGRRTSHGTNDTPTSNNTSVANDNSLLSINDISGISINGTTTSTIDLSNVSSTGISRLSIRRDSQTFETIPEQVKHEYVASGEMDPIINTSCPRKGSIAEDKMKKRLRFFFMNPIEKWRCKRRFPWKLTVQIFKILIVTAQVSMFATQRYNHVNYLWNTKVSFSHLFIKDWDKSMEVDVYPPSSGPLAIYRIKEFYQAVDYAMLMFSQIEDTALGAYKYAKQDGLIQMPQFCYSHYKNCQINLENMTYIVDKEVIENCFDMPASILSNHTDWSINGILANFGHSINFDLLLDAKLSFWLRTIRLTLELPFQTPECYELENTIYFNNMDHNGQMVIQSDIEATVLRCQGFVDSVNESEQSNHVRNFLNFVTLGVCVISFVMCARSLFRAHFLRVTTDMYFRTHLTRSLTNNEKFEFINLWYILFCVSDILVVIGTVLKMTLESKEYEGFLDKWTYCALLLGIGNLLVWFGCLRYLGFFEAYNVLILTVKCCLPSVIRFSVCMMLVFAGYALCGWLVLGPYNLKFRSLSSTVECLFSLINGDDMFSTFASASSIDSVVWWFSRVYLYSFISLFVYVILSLFIAIIMDNYDTVKRYYSEGFPASGLMQFAMECKVDPCDRWNDQDKTLHDMVNSFLCCSYWRKSPLPTEHLSH